MMACQDVFLPHSLQNDVCIYVRMDISLLRFLTEWTMYCKALEYDVNWVLNGKPHSVARLLDHKGADL